MMDFNVKKFAADAGTFLSRAVQVGGGGKGWRLPEDRVGAMREPPARSPGPSLPASPTTGPAGGGPRPGRWARPGRRLPCPRSCPAAAPGVKGGGVETGPLEDTLSSASSPGGSDSTARLAGPHDAGAV